ncbi:MAG: glutamine--fructose-6-phosphate transaminase (isomerizing) [Rickettsiales bacterium]|jgi:glucosamine--fructose-6-phosphate aminotransferase (isomerizing)|nr:glutamine--fructose-6-phosphate transaminase (isomerizing) [Rickettsiales bacterium]
MCGIFAIITNRTNIAKNLINGLKGLEYRGYDSSGIALLSENKIKTIKRCGKINELEKIVEQIEKKNKLEANIGIAHSRWATHGGVSDVNAHPHISSDGIVCVVHNGIIENYKKLKVKLQKEGYNFVSQTDTEVIPNLIAYHYRQTKNEEQAIAQAINDMEGTFAMVVIFRNNNDKIFVARRGSPLLLGVGVNENYVGSGLSAFNGLTNKIISLEEEDFAILTKDKIKIFNNGKEVKRDIEEVAVDNVNVDKGNYSCFMLKEIYEQPKVIEQIIKEYVDTKNKKIVLPHFDFDLSKVERLNMLGCGTASFACRVSRYFIEQVVKIPVNVDVGSEFRYKHPVILPNDISIFVSQSGETADTIGALKVCKEVGQKIVSIVNVLQSSMVKLSDIVFKVLAGAEIGVASTKAFTAQLATIYIFTIELAKIKGTITQKEYEKYIDDLLKLPEQLSKFLNNNDEIKNLENIAKEVQNAKFFLLFGRDIYYPIALEAAMKIREVSYIPCENFTGGEFKHGPIAVVDKNVFVFAINPTSEIFEKTASNIEEVKAREGKIILCGDKEAIEISDGKYYKAITIEKSDNKLMSAILSVIPFQLLAYYIATERGNDIDKPRNLAKSVTVE